MNRRKTPNEVALIIQYRLMMAPKEGLSAVEALCRIAQDLHQAGLETQVTHEQLAKAMAVFLEG